MNESPRTKKRITGSNAGLALVFFMVVVAMVVYLDSMSKIRVSEYNVVVPGEQQQLNTPENTSAPSGQTGSIQGTEAPGDVKELMTDPPNTLREPLVGPLRPHLEDPDLTPYKPGGRSTGEF